MTPWYHHERGPDDVPHPKWLLILLLIVLLATCTGCASTRYLTEEEDKQMSETCGPNKDCAVIRGSVWRQLERALKMCGFRDS